MRSRVGIVLCFAAWLLLLAVPPALADVDCAQLEQGRPGFTTLAKLTINKCLGEDRDEGELAREVSEEIERVADKEATQLDALVAGMNGLVEKAGETLQVGSPESGVTAVMRTRMQALLREVAQRGELRTGLLNPAAWDFDPQNPLLPSRPGGFNVKKYLDEHCPQAGEVPMVCQTAFASSREAVRFSMLISRMLGAPAQLGELLESMQSRGKRWDAYFDQARSQYLWELLLNDRLTVVDDRERTSKGQPMGFRKVPHRQYILLHPSVALEYVDDGQDGEQFKEAVIAEVVGYNQWEWKDDGSMGFALGVSLIATASDRAGTDDFAWGLMLHVNHKYSLAVTDHNSDTGILFTADLAKLWTRVTRERRQDIIAGDE